MGPDTAERRLATDGALDSFTPPPATVPDSPATRRHAVEAARRGWAVFPCRPGDKRPAVDRWEQRACANPELVARHWPEGANVGVACGPSRLVVVDLDRHGHLPDDWRAIPGTVDGLDVFTLLCQWAGETHWPVTHTTATPSGGTHLYFTAPDGATIRNSASALGPGVDVRGAGGYVLSVGSTVGGRAYVVLDDTPPAPLPDWLRSLLAPPRRGQPTRETSGPPAVSAARLRGLVEHVRAGEPGDRNGRLYWAACRLSELVSAGQAATADAELLVSAALEAGLRGGDTEARRTVASGLRMRGSR